MRFGAAGEHRALLLVNVRTRADVSIKLDDNAKKSIWLNLGSPM